MKKLRTPEKDKTNSSSYQSIKHILKKEFNVNSENKGKLAVTIAKGIMYVLFILLAVMFILKIIIDCITGRVDIGTVFVAFFVFVTMNAVLQVMAYNNETKKL